MNGCHSTLHPDRLQHDLIYHSKGNVSWPNVMTRTCQYIKQENLNDKGCDGAEDRLCILKRTINGETGKITVEVIE